LEASGVVPRVVGAPAGDGSMTLLHADRGRTEEEALHKGNVVKRRVGL
jgi:hypothetical protein